MSEPARRRGLRRSPIQFRRRVCHAIITGKAAQARPGLITRTLDRLQAFDGAFLRHLEEQQIGFLMIRAARTCGSRSRISYLTRLSPDIITSILYRLRRRGRLHFERRDDRQDDISACGVTPTDRHVCRPTKPPSTPPAWSWPTPRLVPQK